MCIDNLRISRWRETDVVSAFIKIIVFFSLFFWGGLTPPYPDSWYDYQRLFELVVLTTTSCLVPFVSLSRVPRLLEVSVGCVLVGGVFVFLHAEHLRYVLIETICFYLLICSVIFWSAFLRGWTNSQLLLMSVWLSVIVYIFFRLIWCAAALSQELPLDPFLFFDGFVNPRFFGAWVTLSWPLLLVFPQNNKLLPLGWKAWVGVLVAAVWWAFAIFSGSRATWLSISLVVLIVFFFGSVGRKISVRAILAIFLGFVLHQLFFIFLAEFFTGNLAWNAIHRLRDGLSLSSRDVLWIVALEGISEAPVFGKGPMMFAATNNGVASTAHNFILQLAYEWGLPLALFVVGFAVSWIWNQYKLCRADQSPLRIVLWMSIVGAMVEGQFDGLFSAPHSQLLFCALLAWMLSLDLWGRKKDDGGRELWKVLRFVPLLMAIFLWAAVYPELSDLGEWESETLMQTGVNHFQPRFWLQGVIFFP